MNIKKSIFKVFSTNLLQLITNLIIGFVVPSILSVDAYANLKTYTLYLSYIGLLHFGFIDGLFIKYGGKEIKNIDMSVLKGEHKFLIVIEILVSLVFISIGMLRHDIILFLFGITILPYMIQSFHKYIFQATGDFNKYSLIMNIYTVTYALTNIILAIIFRSSNYIHYCLATLLANFCSMFIFELSFYKMAKNKKAEVTKENLKTIKIGLFIMLGNLAVMGLFGIDKWFIKLFFSNEEFAYYSFAVSMLNIVNVLVNAISITFYNFLFKNNSKEKINILKKDLIVLGSFSSLAYFPLAFIVNNFLAKYRPSLDIISITFSIFPYMILLNALYVNLYKVNKNERKYFKVVIAMLAVSIGYNIIALCFRKIYGIAFATLMTLITWYVYSSFDLKKINKDLTMFVYPIFMSILFLLSTKFFDVYIGCVVYLLMWIVFTIILYKDVIISIRTMIKDFVKKET